MSSLALLVLLLLALVLLMLVTGLAYVTHRHPPLATPLLVATGGAAVVMAALGVIAGLD
ncbi:hypothetical protein [Streptomyces sp. CAU 1734]|uniref:hypothetical protein n=1 Tax=Streptomyces sp. CAU 1734 TaxID=3140360 RepID=UPI00325FFEDA